MHYYIDGYNLLFRLYGNRHNFSKQRQYLIDELNQKAELLNLSITIVFDSQHQDTESTRSHYKHIIIVFTELNETADERILDEIRSEKKPHLQTVVTSDKKLAWFARRCSAKTESIEHFTEWLYKRNENRLRQNKVAPREKKKITAQPVPEQEIKKDQSPKVPEADRSVESCSDYYLDMFQKRFDQLAKEPTKSTHKKEVKRKTAPKPSKKPPKHEDQPLSDTARWQQIFENRVNENPEK